MIENNIKLVLENFRKYKCYYFIMFVLMVIVFLYGIYSCYFKYEKQNKLEPASKHIQKTIDELSLSTIKDNLVEVADINQSYINMVKYKYRTNLLTNINAMGVIVIGAIGASPIKWLSIPLSIVEGVSILYAEKTSKLYEECKERYLLLQDIVDVDGDNLNELKKLRIKIIDKNSLCLY